MVVLLAENLPQVLGVIKGVIKENLLDGDFAIMDSIAHINLRPLDGCQDFTPAKIPDDLNQTNLLDFLSKIDTIELPFQLSDGTLFTGIGFVWFQFLNKLGIKQQQVQVHAQAA